MGSEEDPVERLFVNAMKGCWNEVIDAYKNQKDLQDKAITRSGATALHIAVADNKTEVVSELVNIIGNGDEESRKKKALEILSIKNERGDTALHLAARIGNVEMCRAMAEKYPDLIKIQNNENETPLFCSVLHGKKKAYLCLRFHYQYKDDYTLCRRGNGDTILHCAISSDYFGLAYKIIKDYPDLSNSVNESGLSPLHVLANEHNAFRSGSVFSMVDRFIYRCIIVDQLPEEKEDRTHDHNDSGPETRKYPENYADCMILFRLMVAFFKFNALSRHRILRKLLGLCGFFREMNPQENDRSSGFSSSQKSVKPKDEENPPESCSSPKTSPGMETTKVNEKIEVYPPSYETIVLYLKLVINVLLIIFGLGYFRIQKIKEKKEQHAWANLLMNELVERASFYKYDNTGRKPEDRDDDQTKVPDYIPKTDIDEKAKDSSSSATDEATNVTSRNRNKENPELKKKETAILIAAKQGVVEMVDKILDKFPVAIGDEDADKKNVVLLAVEHRQTEVYNHLLHKTMFRETVFRHLDSKGNSALHLAAKFGDIRPKLITGAALHMQWEMKWYKFVKESMPRYFFAKHNNKGETPREIFRDTHKELVAKGSEWLTKTSESCSLVAALIATVAFATSATVPGGVKEETGEPTFENQPAFDVFAISSLIALCFSVTALVFFLSILTSRYQENDFTIDLPRKLLLGLSSLFISIAAMLLSFCAGHFFVLKDKLRYAVFPIYTATCLPVTFFAFAQLPLYFDLTRAIFNKEPQRGYRY